MVESILILGIASPYHLPPFPAWLFSGRLLGLPVNEFSAVSDLLLWSNLKMNWNLTDNNWRFSHLSLFFNNVAVMLRWSRLVVLSMIMSGMWSASGSAWPRLQNEGLHQLSRPLCWLPTFFSGCCCKLGLILFPFLLVARLCCPGSRPCWLSQSHWGYPVASGAAAILNCVP